ncbi:DUF2849 domain-containing protein, partial [Brucella abortus]
RIRLSGPTIVTMGHAFPAPAS